MQLLRQPRLLTSSFLLAFFIIFTSFFTAAISQLFEQDDAPPEIPNEMTMAYLDNNKPIMGKHLLVMPGEVK